MLQGNNRFMAVMKNRNKELCTLSAQEVYQIIHEGALEAMQVCEPIRGNRKLYYISAEFLLGKMLTCNLINLNLWDDAQAFAEAAGYEWPSIQAKEKEPSLGNGGLGRLAACFMDSIASLNLQGDGIGLFYHFGLFRQQFRQLKQEEYPNAWIASDSWFQRKEVSFEVPFAHVTLQPVCYDMDVIGATGKKNTLHLFDVAGVDETLVKQGITFDKKAIEKNLTLFLYPDDSDDDGRKLRIYQQYFMVSCGAQLILQECREKGWDIWKLDEHIAIQINDTHPTLIIPELIRLLMQEGMRMKDAIGVVERTCAYTNHTILAEALETWPLAVLQEVVPMLTSIIQALDSVANARNAASEVAIIDAYQNVHMAHIDIHFGKHVNGVAKLHTDILKESELHGFYQQYPDKFNNKTNGITFRRWLQACNPLLYQCLCRYANGDIITGDATFASLLNIAQPTDLLQELLNIKQENKRRWVKHMRLKQNLVINDKAIFDTQVKRMHEYKRQQMNVLYIIYKYLQICAGIRPKRPIVFIFGAKAAPAYTIAKDIIHVILTLEHIIAHNPLIAPYIQICFIENYNISEAELVIPASDISEQISLASKEASGTGNMKFMLNGAITIGTMDGANVEIADAVGHDNMYIFGKDSETVIQHYAKADYISRDYYNRSEVIKQCVDFLIKDEMQSCGDIEALTRVYDELRNKDWFMTLLDFESYIACKDRMFEDFEQREAWAYKMLRNIASAEFFNSDRTIKEYDRDIWHLS